jgi:hypothetical protein
MMMFETIEHLIELSNPLLVYHHVGAVAIRLPHDLVHDKLRVAIDVKPLDHKLSNDVHAIDEYHILHNIVGCAEVQSNHIEEPISLRED